MINKVDSGAAIKPAQKKGLQGAFYALPRMATFSPLEREEHIVMWGGHLYACRQMVFVGWVEVR